MDQFTDNDLELLARERAGTSISIYLRTHEAGSETRQDPIRYRNMLSGAEERLTALGMRASEARALLEPAARLGAEKAFWQFQGAGLAVFIAEGLFRSYRLPVPFDDLLVVSGRFHLTPLVPLVADAIRYYLLTLSRSRVRLFEGKPSGLEEIALPGVPQGMEQAVTQDQNEAFEQYHVRAGGGAGRETALFYGRGEGGDDDIDRISRYFHRVNSGIRDFLKDRESPLLIAGVEYLLPLYRSVNTFPGLMEQAITGNVDQMNAGELHAKAQLLIEPLIEGRRQEAREQLKKLLGTGKASIDVPEIVSASYQGRVSTLLVSAAEHEWGTVDRSRAGAVGRICGRQEDGCEDLFDFAAVQTLLNRGKVYVVRGEPAADKAPIAAVFRY